MLYIYTRVYHKAPSKSLWNRNIILESTTGLHPYYIIELTHDTRASLCAHIIISIVTIVIMKEWFLSTNNIVILV